MTFSEIVTDIQRRTGLTSSDATTRLGVAVNTLYKRLTASLGIDSETRRVTTTAVTGATVFVTFTGIEKVITIKNADGELLSEVSQATIDAATVGDDAPTRYAIYRVSSGSVVVQLDTIPDDAATLTALGYDRQDTLSGSMEPSFPESFHYVLIEGVLQQELRKQEKVALADMARQEYERGLSELRLFLAKSRHLTRRQGERLSSSLLSVGGGAASATDFVFLQEGTGAVSRSAMGRMRETFSVEDFGAVGDGTTDDTAAIQLALDAAETRGGGIVYALKPEYGITEDIVIPPNVSLCGGGLTKFIAISDSFSRAMVVCGAYIAPGGAWTSEGPEGNRFGCLQNLYIDGNDIADVGLYVGGAVQRVFLNINVRHCLVQGAIVDGAQNNFFLALHCEKNGSDPPGTYDANLVLDRGAGNNVFVGVELSGDPDSDRGKYNLLIRQSAGSPSGVFARPSQNRFFGGVFERGGDQYGACVYQRAGYLNTFVGIDVSVSGVTPAIPALVCDDGDSVGSYLTIWESCVFSGDLGSNAVELTDSADHRFHNPTLIGFDIGWELDDDSTAYVTGRLHEGSVTTRAAKSGGSIGITRRFFYDSNEWTTPTFAAGDYTANGSMTWTVASGDRVVGQYKVAGKTATYRFDIITSTIGGTPNTTLMIALPGGLVAAKYAYRRVAYFTDNGTVAEAICWVEPAGTVLNIRRVDAANLTASTDNTQLKGDLEFEVS